MSRRGYFAQLDVDYLTRGENVLRLRRDIGRLLVAAWWPRLVTKCTAGDLNELQASIDVRELAAEIGDERPDAEVMVTIDKFIDAGLIELVHGDISSGIITIKLISTPDMPAASTLRWQKHRDAVEAASKDNVQDTGLDKLGRVLGQTDGVQLYVLRASKSGRVKIALAVDPESMAKRETTKQGETVTVLHTKTSGFAEAKRIERALEDQHLGGKWYPQTAVYHRAVIEAYKGVPTPSQRVPTIEEKNSDTREDRENKVSDTSGVSEARETPEHTDEFTDPLTAGTPRRRGGLAETVSASVERLLDVLGVKEGEDGWRNFYDLAYKGATEADIQDAIGALREVEGINNRQRYAYSIIKKHLKKRGLLEPHPTPA